MLLNINLAFINLLPIPVLDGGHILMAVLEKIRRRPLSLKFVEYTTTCFFVLLISFMLYITIFGDIKRLPLYRSMFNTQTCKSSKQPALRARATQVSHAPLRISLFSTNAARRARSSLAIRRAAASSSAAIIPSSCSPCSPATRWTLPSP